MTAKTNWFSKLSDDAKAKAKEVLAEIKIYMAEEVQAAATMVEGALADGTVIKFVPDANGALGIGSDVVIVSQDGEIPAPDGDLTLADGTVVTISTGKAVEVKAATAPAEADMNDAKALADVKERVTKIVEKFEAQFKSQEDVIKKQNIQIENLKLKLGKLAKITQDISLVQEAFGAIETAEAIEKPKPTNDKKAAMVAAITGKK